MKRDFRTAIILLVFSLPVLAVLWFGSIYIVNCGIYADCSRGFLAPVIHTPIPTLIPATLPAPTQVVQVATSPVAAGTPGGIPRPSNPGGPGQAVNLSGDPASGADIFASNCAICHGDQGKGGVSNPGSLLGTVPALNPINPSLKSPDLHTFATNLDLYIEHGSTPIGTNPFRSMPAWGDQKALTPQQIADVIAYIISMNK
jgi:mono/diheme cytochrome c family protein